MHMRKLLAAAAVVVPLGSVVAVAGPVGAVTPPPGNGTLACAISGDMTFYPPLTAYGTAGFKHEIIQFNLDAADCTGPDTNTPQPNPTSGSLTTHQIKAPDAKMGSTKVAGACYTSGFNAQLLLKSTATWGGGATVRDTKTKIGPLTGAGNNQPAFTGTGTAQRSYFGSASLYVELDSDSANALAQICEEGMPGSISELDFDPTASSLTIGQTGS